MKPLLFTTLLLICLSCIEPKEPIHYRFYFDTVRIDNRYFNTPYITIDDWVDDTVITIPLDTTHDGYVIVIKKKH